MHCIKGLLPQTPYVVMIHHPPIALVAIVKCVSCCSSLEFEHNGIVVPIREWNYVQVAGMPLAVRGQAVNAFPEKLFGPSRTNGKSDRRRN